MNMPTPRHGQICSKIDRIVGSHAEQHTLGHVVVNGSGIITQREPDTMRWANIAFYSYSRVPPGPLPNSCLTVVPELVFEVRSPTYLWNNFLSTVAEHLNADVRVVCVLDQVGEAMVIFRDDEPPRKLHGDDEFELPALLGNLKVKVQRFFE